MHKDQCSGAVHLGQDVQTHPEASLRAGGSAPRKKGYHAKDSQGTRRLCFDAQNDYLLDMQISTNKTTREAARRAGGKLRTGPNVIELHWRTGSPTSLRTVQCQSLLKRWNLLLSRRGIETLVAKAHPNAQSEHNERCETLFSRLKPTRHLSA